MKDYGFLNIPTSCLVKSIIFKKLFYEHANLSVKDKDMFIKSISKITWLYCLKPETINIQTYKDDIRDYSEIEVIEVELTEKIKTKRIVEIIMKTIPYPSLLILKKGEQLQLCVAHQRMNQNDSSRNTIEELILTDWLDYECVLLKELDIKELRFTNYYELYSDIMDALSIYKVSDKVQSEVILTGEEARALAAGVEMLEQMIMNLRTKLRKETQFNRKMDINMEIKILKKKLNELLGGDLTS